jgi:hypothetical protein
MCHKCQRKRREKKRLQVFNEQKQKKTVNIQQEQKKREVNRLQLYSKRYQNNNKRALINKYNSDINKAIKLSIMEKKKYDLKKKENKHVENAIKKSIDEKQLHDMENKQLENAIKKSIEEKQLHDTKVTQLENIINKSIDEKQLHDMENKQLENVINKSIEEKQLHDMEKKQLENAIIHTKKENKLHDIDSNTNNMKIKQLDNYINERVCNIMLDIDKHNVKIINYKKEQNTICFIIGRGHIEYKSGLNIPINPLLLKHKLIYIDRNKDIKPDISSQLHEVDFKSFNIPDDTIIKFYFDWSSFYCGGLDSILKITQDLKRTYEIYVPLSSSENTIPSEIERTLFMRLYNIILVNDKYPLFDWSVPILPSTNRPITEHVNSSKYIKIIYTHPKTY